MESENNDVDVKSFPTPFVVIENKTLNYLEAKI